MTPTPPAAAAADLPLARELAAIAGEANVLADEAARRLASSDIFVWPDAMLADLVVRPGSTEETARVVALLAREGRAVVPRGARLSYTAGAVPHGPAVVVDTARLDRIEIRAEDLCAVVGAGCTWERVDDALRAHGLRAAQPGPISGSRSTVGGAAAQSLPGGMDGVVGLTVVLADGTVAKTGSAARGVPFHRHGGPDLTGMFLGDCGAFGIKTEVALRLAARRAAAFASFGLNDADDAIAAAHALLERGLVTRVMVMDRAKGEGATQVDAGEAARIVGAVAKGAGSPGRALKDAAQLALRRGALRGAAWSLHFTVEAASEQAAEADIALARRLVIERMGERAREIDNVLPKTLHARPYSIRGIVGPQGERWVPVHGILPLSQARPAMAALRAHLAAQAQALAGAGVSVQWLASSVGAYLTIEPMFYWRDRLDELQLAQLSERNRARFAGAPENAAARALVARLRAELRDLLDRHGAVHVQTGRFYRLAELMDPGSRMLLARVKRALDPDGRMNPGALA